ncbi:hypothetical protein L3Q82_001524 [Scortum barcoo]|uniref:Uncharacterized protein n=1 Tax=Scortum barcoo TaxID=214431 RepID=A0ACB8W7C1_9TELE|nr:hypothetical protein L3Q82_001524 [Scortum barcoo]
MHVCIAFHLSEGDASQLPHSPGRGPIGSVQDKKSVKAINTSGLGGVSPPNIVIPFCPSMPRENARLDGLPLAPSWFFNGFKLVSKSEGHHKNIKNMRRLVSQVWPEQPRPDCPGPGPGPSCVSLKSDRSIGRIIKFKDGQQSDDEMIQHERPDSPEPESGSGPSCVSLKSDRSMGRHVDFKDGQQSDDEMTQQQIPVHRTLSCVSMKSDHFRRFYTRKQERHFAKIQHERLDCPGPGSGPSCVSLKSDRSMKQPILFKDGQQSDDEIVQQQRSEVPIGQSVQQHQTHLDSIFKKNKDRYVARIRQVGITGGPTLEPGLGLGLAGERLVSLPTGPGRAQPEMADVGPAFQ